MVVPKECQEYRDKHNITWRITDDGDGGSAKDKNTDNEKQVTEAKTESEANAVPNTNATKNVAAEGNAAPKVATDETVVEKPDATTGQGVSPKVVNPDAAPSKPVDGSSAMEGVVGEGGGKIHENGMHSGNEKGEEKKDADPSSETKTITPPPKPDSTTATQAATLAIREGKSEGKFAAMAQRKRDSEGITKEPQKVEKEEGKEIKSISVKDSKGRLVKVLDDDEEELDCEFLNNRQAFLNLCQGNHYQFDHIRRAKHTSMMVLWHLHNRDAPKFVQQCATCSREILAGYRFHCPTCADFDQCQECYANPKVARHLHTLKPVPVATGQQNELTEVQRRERQRSIQLHMTLLLHAATCASAKCPSANCTKMKGLLKHGAQCQIKAAGGCNVCKRIWALLQIHARQCKNMACPVPNCMAIRERVRQLKKQQQAMDDRRRQEMNRAYRGKR
jgi:E1A/CREB-binding protein